MLLFQVLGQPETPNSMILLSRYSSRDSGQLNNSGRLSNRKWVWFSDSRLEDIGLQQTMNEVIADDKIEILP